MRYEIFGQPMPAVTLHLDQGESVYTQSGGMSWMTDRISMDTNMKGGLLKGLGRMFSGESLFMATYTAQAPEQSFTCASTFPGNIMALQLNGSVEYICQKSAFLCAQPTVELSAFVVKGMTGGFFGGEGFVLQRLHGQGLAFVELDGSLKEYDLQSGQRMKVDTGNVAIFESTVKYSAEMVSGFKNVLFGGEGLFLTTLEGPGKVWLQTMTLPGLAGRLVPYLPSSKN
ncbi:MAG: TIGR00266 family protein [Oscillospiraceae bacterium]|nr:TIGR00266 family protein [Oscillospiraceae bacterium]